MVLSFQLTPHRSNQEGISITRIFYIEKLTLSECKYSEININYASNFLTGGHISQNSEKNIFIAIQHP